jgi:alpha-amylase
LSETYSHSLASLKDKTIFEEQVKLHDQNVSFGLFGQKPSSFQEYGNDLFRRNRCAEIAEMGYKGMLTEGAKHILGWKSPNYVYVNAINPRE